MTVAVRLRHLLIATFVGLPLLAGASSAGQAVDGLRVEILAEGLEYPWSLAFLPSGDLLVTERAGRLRVIRDGRLVETPIGGVPAVHAAGQGGLLDVLVAPDFSDSRTLFLTLAHGDARANATRVVRARLEDDRLTEVTPIFTARPTKSTAAHYGGRLLMLPDGSLLLGLGDGFNLREQAQDLGSHLGKIVRFHADGSVPDDNPFVGREDVLPEIYSYGHRNIQGLARDPVSGHVYAHEHGPRGGDELNVIRPGANYGWPLATHGRDYSGALVSPYRQLEGMEDALLGWTPSIAPSGLARYDGELFAGWQGDLLVTALAARELRRVQLRDGQVVGESILLKGLGERLRDVRVGPEGAIYVLTDAASGQLLRLTPAQ